MRATTALGTLAIAMAAAHMGSARASVMDAVVPDDFPTVQEALDALDKTGGVFEPHLHIRPGVYDGPVMATGFTKLRITADAGATIVASGSEPALTVCGSGLVILDGLAIESQSVGLFVNGVGRVAATDLVIDAGSHGVLAESSMSFAEIKAMFSLSHVEALVGVTATDFQLTGGTVTSRHDDAIRIGQGESAGIGGVTLIAPEGDGIHAEDPAGVVGAVAVAITVGGVTIDGAGDDGIDVAGRPLQMNPGTTITRPADDGVTIGPGASGWVLGVTIRDCGDIGIESHDGGRFDTISGCTISGTGGDGIHAEAGRIGSCTVTDTGGNGIVAATDRMQVIGNDVTSTAQDGLRVTGGDVYVYTNTVTLAGDAGIRVEGEGAYVNDNVVESATGDGIALGSGWGEVTGDTVTNSGGDGICVLGAPARTGAELSKNVVEGSAGDGIDLGAATGVRVAANTVTECGDCGFRLGDGAKKNRLTGNRADHSGSYDLYESDASHKNRIARNNRFRTRRHRGAN
jgi:hypothetical protein